MSFPKLRFLENVHTIFLICALILLNWAQYFEKSVHNFTKLSAGFSKMSKHLLNSQKSCHANILHGCCTSFLLLRYYLVYKSLTQKEDTWWRVQGSHGYTLTKCPIHSQAVNNNNHHKPHLLHFPCGREERIEDTLQKERESERRIKEVKIKGIVYHFCCNDRLCHRIFHLFTHGILLCSCICFSYHFLLSVPLDCVEIY